TIDAIEFNLESPSAMGEPILITIKANDSEGDKIYYRFMIKGPKDQEFMSPTGWYTDNKWEWIPTDDEVGINKIRVYVRDEKHLDEEDNYVEKIFKITKDASALTSDALVLYGQGKYDEAIKAYGEAIKLDPNYKEAFYNKGLALAALDKRNEAIQAYDEAIKLDPNYKEAFYNKGLALAALHKRNEAIQAYDEAIKLDPNYKEAFYNKGLALDALDNCSEAIEAYDEAIKLDPNFEDAIVAKESANKGGFIRVKCNGIYNARFTLSYRLEGAPFKKESGNIKPYAAAERPIPACATDIHLKVEEEVLLDWRTVFTTNYDEPVTKCFTVSGDFLKLHHEETNCPR
ncbi:MAG: tetratricopeptide repeat protein, partial [Methanothrix sp.]